MKKRKTKTICLLATILLIGGGGYVLARHGLFNSFFISEKRIVKDVTALVDDAVENPHIEHPDADAYYEQHSEVVSTIDAIESADTQTEKEIQSLFKERGFDKCEIFSEYSMDGVFRDSSELTNEAEKHPVYQTYYISSSGEIWTISSINGQITAYPASFNIQAEPNVPVLYAETNTIISYDSVANKFYVTIPHESELIVRTIEKIDSETLDKIIFEEIGKKRSKHLPFFA